MDINLQTTILIGTFNILIDNMGIQITQVWFCAMEMLLVR